MAYLSVSWSHHHDRADGVMKRARVPMAAPPGVSVVSDRPAYHAGQLVRIGFRLRNGPAPLNLMMYAALRRPDGGLRGIFFKVGPQPNPPCLSWIPKGSPFALPRYAEVELPVGLWLRDEPPGPSTSTSC